MRSAVEHLLKTSFIDPQASASSLTSLCWLCRSACGLCATLRRRCAPEGSSPRRTAALRTRALMRKRVEAAVVSACSARSSRLSIGCRPVSCGESGFSYTLWLPCRGFTSSLKGCQRADLVWQQLCKCLCRGRYGRSAQCVGPGCKQHVTLTWTGDIDLVPHPTLVTEQHEVKSASNHFAKARVLSCTYVNQLEEVSWQPESAWLCTCQNLVCLMQDSMSKLLRSSSASCLRMCVELSTASAMTAGSCTVLLLSPTCGWRPIIENVA